MHARILIVSSLDAHSTCGAALSYRSGPASAEAAYDRTAGKDEGRARSGANRRCAELSAANALAAAALGGVELPTSASPAPRGIWSNRSPLEQPRRVDTCSEI